VSDFNSKTVSKTLNRKRVRESERHTLYIYIMSVERETLLQPTRVGLSADVEKKNWHYISPLSYIKISK